jgi:amidophosphoribosyltransferase
MARYDALPLEARMVPDAFLGHGRYSTQGKATDKNVQPVMAHYPRTTDLKTEIESGPTGITLAMVVNGETWIQDNWEERIKGVDMKGATSDSAKLAGMIVQAYSQKPDIKSVLSEFYREIFDYGMIAAAGILVDDVTHKQYMFYMADGGRPLWEAKVDGYTIGISETGYLQALNLKGRNDVKDIRQIRGGTIKIQDLQTKEIFTLKENRVKPRCFFDNHYLQLTQSMFGMNGKKKKMRSNASYRRACGRCLAVEHPPPKHSIVTAIPQSGISYTHGFCDKANRLHRNIRQEEILIRSLLTKEDRSFMNSQERAARGNTALWKLDVVIPDCEGKVVVAVDDSTVEGNIFMKTVYLLRRAGAKEVHIRSACPPIVAPCNGGIYIPAERPLVRKLGFDPQGIAKDHSALEEKLKCVEDPDVGMIKVDSFGYLSIESLKKCLGKKKFCMGCITLEYPYKFKDMEKFGAKFVPSS